MEKRVRFKSAWLPWLLIAPQMAIVLVFFFWPAGQALWQSVLQQDAFGTSSEFVGLENFSRLWADDSYLASFQTTALFSLLVAASGLTIALLLAVMANRVVRGAGLYKTLLIWPYAVAPALAAVLWLFIFHPSIGLVGRGFATLGINWDFRVNGGQAMAMVIIAAAWKQVSYNFIFFLAGLQSIPTSVLEAAAIDGARPFRRFWTVIFPLLSPTAFFLLVVNLVYAFFDTFGVIHALTRGGPGNATETLIYKVYVDGVQNLNFGSSAAQSVILMIIVIGLTAIQFRFIERRVHY